ncbi:hypothetical protein F5X68DRAFT_204899 [Plectosphaerella plurivora]|uniref:CBM1 domain-containing protein n=1 Tax=Plectosphaerella plurivora TaxID=936078 RepID=A0A9P9ABJ4_9PEZI|nr:hypothetical protein F5X68DRAFT_204899 [Plectosphaerella plurivora]
MKTTTILMTMGGLVAAQAPAWGQGGGQGWAGPTTCASGWTFVASNEWYSQCLQGGPGSSPPPSTPPPAASLHPLAAHAEVATPMSRHGHWLWKLVRSQQGLYQHTQSPSAWRQNVERIPARALKEE